MIEPDGSIVAGGDNEETIGFGLDQFSAAGSVLWQSALGYAPSNLSGLCVQPDGKIVAVGSAGYLEVPNDEFLLARYNADGSLDSTFGTGGVVTTSFSGDDYARSVAIENSGELLVAGTDSTTVNATSQFALAEYTVAESA